VYLCRFTYPEYATEVRNVTFTHFVTSKEIRKGSLNCDALPKNWPSYTVETLHHRSQYPVVATHPTLSKSTKPFILGYSVFVIVLHFSAPGKACLSVCSVTLLAYWPAIVLTSVSI